MRKLARRAKEPYMLHGTDLFNQTNSNLLLPRILPKLARPTQPSLQGWLHGHALEAYDDPALSLLLCYCLEISSNF